MERVLVWALLPALAVSTALQVRAWSRISALEEARALGSPADVALGAPALDGIRTSGGSSDLTVAARQAGIRANLERYLAANSIAEAEAAELKALVEAHLQRMADIRNGGSSRSFSDTRRELILEREAFGTAAVKTLGPDRGRTFFEVIYPQVGGTPPSDGNVPPPPEGSGPPPSGSNAPPPEGGAPPPGGASPAGSAESTSTSSVVDLDKRLATRLEETAKARGASAGDLMPSAEMRDAAVRSGRLESDETRALLAAYAKAFATLGGTGSSP